jgi:hypothetical protein
VRRADNLTTLMCRLSGSLNLLDSSRPRRPVSGLNRLSHEFMPSVPHIGIVSFRHLQRHSAPTVRKTSISEGRKLNSPQKLGFLTCPKVGTWDILFYFPSEGRHAEHFFTSEKIQRIRLGSNPRTREPEASMLTTRPPKLSVSGLLYLYLTVSY